MLISGYGIGRGIHMVRARVRAKIGAIINIETDEVRGRKGSLMNSLTASAMGWRRPYGPTMFGPFRSCIYPRTFRSIRVRNATARSTGTISVRRLIVNMLLERGIEPLVIKV